VWVTDQAQHRVCGGEGFHCIGGAIGAAIVNNDDLAIIARVLKVREYALQRSRQALFFVVRRNNDAQIGAALGADDVVTPLRWL